MTGPIDFDPHEAERAREVFNGMAVIYGFFFILLSAIIAVTGDFLAFTIDTTVDISVRTAGAMVMYALILFIGLGTAIFGAGLNETAEKMVVSDYFTDGLLVVTLSLPLFFSVLMGLLIRMPWMLILFESILIETYAIQYSVRKAYKERKFRKVRKDTLANRIRAALQESP